MKGCVDLYIRYRKSGMSAEDALSTAIRIGYLAQFEEYVDRPNIVRELEKVFSADERKELTLYFKDKLGIDILKVLKGLNAKLTFDTLGQSEEEETDVPPYAMRHAPGAMPKPTLPKA